jgi:hypothetical protein
MLSPTRMVAEENRPASEALTVRSVELRSRLLADEALVAPALASSARAGGHISWQGMKRSTVKQ